MSGRSGWASSPALRPAVACDRAGTARRADPRCSPPSYETLGRGQRLHPPVWPLGTRTLRRHGSYRPRGGSHHHPRSRMKRSRGPATEQPGPDFNVSSRRVGVSNRPAGASGHPSGGCGLPSGRTAWGIAGVASYEQRGAPPRDVPARSQPEESWRAASGGEQATRGRAPVGHNKKPLGGDREGATCEPARTGKEITSTKWKRQQYRAPAGQKRLHAAKRKTPVRTGGGGAATRAGVPAPRVR
jgi:hypothetical protein